MCIRQVPRNHFTRDGNCTLNFFSATGGRQRNDDLRMGAEIKCREDEQGVAGKVGNQYEQAVLAQGIALEVSENYAFNQEGDGEGDGQPNQGIALKEDKQDAVDDTGNEVHQKGNLDAGAGWVPAEEGQDDSLDETEEEIDDEQGEETEDSQYVGGSRTGDGGEKGGRHEAGAVIRKDEA